MGEKCYVGNPDFTMTGADLQRLFADRDSGLPTLLPGKVEIMLGHGTPISNRTFKDARNTSDG